MLTDLFRILLSLDPNDTRGGGDPDAPDGADGGEAGGDGVDDLEPGDASEREDEDDEGSGEGGSDDADSSKKTAGTVAAKTAADSAFVLSDRDMKLIGQRIPSATLNRWKATPEGQQAIRDAIEDARDELVEKSLNGSGEKDDGANDGIDYDKKLSEMIPDFAPDEETAKELAATLGEKGNNAMIAAFGANKQVRAVLGNIIRDRDRLAGAVSQNLVETQLAMYVESVAPDMDDAGYEALRNKVASAARGTKNLTPRTIIKLAKQAREEMNAPNANRAAREKMEKTMQDRNKHNGAIPDKTAKVPANTPKSPLERMKANGKRFMAEQEAAVKKKK